MPEALELKLLPERTLGFLIQIVPKTLIGDSERESQNLNRLAHIAQMTDELEDSINIVNTSEQLLELTQKSYRDSDLRQAIGWLRWFFILQLYSQKHYSNTDKNKEIAESMLNNLLGMLQTTTHMASQTNDYDALLLVASFWGWIGIDKMCDEILKQLREHIGIKAINERLLKIKKQPRMFSESPLAERLQQHILISDI